MKAIVKRKDFLNLLAKANLVIGRGSDIPALENILLTVEQNKLKTLLTNLEQHLIRSCNTVISKEGGILVKPRLLEKFLRSVKSEEVTLVTDHSAVSNELVVQCPNSFLNLDGLPAEDFPNIPYLQQETKSIRVNGLSKALKGIAYAMRSDKLSGYEYFPGLCFTPCDNKIELAAIDGHRLAITTVETDSELPYQFTLPYGAVQIILGFNLDEVVLKMEDKNSQEPRIAISQDEEITLISRLVLERFPNYKPIMAVPKEAKELEIEAELLKRGMVIVSSVFTSSIPSPVELKLSTDENLILSSERHEFGKIEVRIEAQGEIENLLLDRKYFNDMVDRVDGEITMYTTKPEESLIVSCQNFIHVIMPMRR